MAIKHLLVHVDGGEASSARLDLAVGLAKRFGAGLTGLFAEQRTGAGKRGRARLREGRSAAEVERAFAEQTRSLSGETEFWKIPNTEFDIPGVAARYARYADLAIVGQHDREDPRVPADFAEKVLLESGRPVLAVPLGCKLTDVGRTVVFAWDGSREGARALNDALPLLSRSKGVTVALVRHPGTRVPRDDRSAPSILRHLARHGVTAQYEPVVVDKRGGGPTVLDAVLNLAADLGADLVVMGGRGKHGTPFPRAARKTRASLEVMTAPLLLSA